MGGGVAPSAHIISVTHPLREGCFAPLLRPLRSKSQFSQPGTEPAHSIPGERAPLPGMSQVAPVHPSGRTARLDSATSPVLPLPCPHDEHVLPAARSGQALAQEEIVSNTVEKREEICYIYTEETQGGC